MAEKTHRGVAEDAETTTAFFLGVLGDSAMNGFLAIRGVLGVLAVS